MPSIKTHQTITMANFRTICTAIVYIISTSTSVVLFELAPNYALTYDDYANLCAPTISCDSNTKYRSINGSCNNLKTPWLGASITPHLRILDAYYDDGEYEFRRQTNGNPLPNARYIQLKLFLDKQFPYQNDHNVLFMEWGQFIAHDTTHLPPDVSVGSNCCDLQKNNPVPPQCQAVIEVPANDPTYSKLGQTCINFNRARTSISEGCQLKPATFMVQATHFIDGSQIYGSGEEIAANLRSFKNGRLKSDFFVGQQEFCPQRNRTSLRCDTSAHSLICYSAGDSRVNQNLAIALFQNLFLRFHNIVAYQLYRFNPFWSDEEIYQESRRIVIAVIQHITYTHYLPILLGEKFMYSHGFFGQTVYDETVNPSTTLEHSTGAFRILHKQIPTVLNMIDENHFNFHRVLLTDWMNIPDLLPLPNNFDGLLRGFQETPTREEQPSYNTWISNFLFQQTTPKFRGNDLLSADIQRGRDTGMPPYNKMRSVCGVPEATEFDDLIDLIAYEDIQKLKTLYSCVDDIDFIVGALLEMPAEGSKVGPTSQCIIADNFYRQKIGDRFFYDVRGQPGSFTPDQLHTLKNVNFGNVICATSNLRYLPEDIFMPFDSKSNTRQIDCNVFTLNLNAWKDIYFND
ncbi:peroxidase-like [Rhopalosiphum padi]|uniref:peroxidase-like n=1 Tax=Rhopalosiphum padi TaxID=40932 RepID=UPI00298DA707|nr:peroxidase-like [Rhopalosiphum padi]